MNKNVTRAATAITTIARISLSSFLAYTTLATAIQANPAFAVESQAISTAEAKNIVYGNFGSAESTCVVMDDLLDVDITLNSVRGSILTMTGTVSSDAGHFKGFTHLTVRSQYSVNDSVQLSLAEIEPGTYTATVFGTGTTTGGVFGFTTACEFTVQ